MLKMLASYLYGNQAEEKAKKKWNQLESFLSFKGYNSMWSEIRGVKQSHMILTADR
jgi:hypothetical protein